MSSSIIATAVGAIVSALQTAPAVAPVVDRVRLRPVAAGISTAIVVRPIGAEVVQHAMSGQALTWAATIAVECYARTRTGAAAAADAAVDPVLTAAYARIMADPHLGGAALAIVPGTLAYDFDADGEQLACVALQLQLTLRSPARDLTA